MIRKKRKYERKHLTYYLKVYDRKTNQLVGRLCDITPDGIMLISEDPIGTNVTLDLRIELPHKVSGKKHLDIQAKSLWVKKDVVPDYFDTGFMLTEASQQHQKFIEKIIKEFAVDEDSG
jgi:hypothetical protein